jgi:hypothetical protein
LLFAIASVYLGKNREGWGVARRRQMGGRKEERGEEGKLLVIKQKTGTRRVFLDYFF